MNIIKILDENTANKIAAGEVVDRPSSVIKELVENAIDAGSTKIEIEIMAGGISFMRVTDNGCGMSKADLKLSVQRHATSKLRTAADLNNIETLGFRGEALATIAAVSKFSILSRQAEADFASIIEISGGTITDFSEAGGNIGTTVKVEDLFYNTPARKKFLKTPSSEGSNINEIVVKLAISHPQIAIRFINNNKLVIATPGQGNLFETIKNIYGSKVSAELLEVNAKTEEFSIKGFLSKPTVLRSSRQWQTFIVNNRVINSRSIAKAIDNAYHSLLPKSGYPLAVLAITIPNIDIDVNVHPQKSELKFADEGRLFRAVYHAIVDTIKKPQEVEEIVTNIHDLKPKFHDSPLNFVERPYQDIPVVENNYYANKDYENFSQNNHYNDCSTEQTVLREKINTVLEENRLNDYQVQNTMENRFVAAIGQVDNCYIIATDGSGLFIIDQHAAHERILYDRFAKNTDKIPSQQLLMHIFMDLTEKECEFINDNKEVFIKLGFNMEQAGPNSMRLLEVPSDVQIVEAENIIKEILESLENLHNVSPQELRHQTLQITACKAAIKAGDKLSLMQMNFIIEELNNTMLPYTCPHGRPSIIKFSSNELAKMFKRT